MTAPDRVAVLGTGLVGTSVALGSGCLSELRHLDLDDIKWDLGRFGKIHVRHGKGARDSGPRVGLLVCRTLTNKTLFIRRCRDTALDRRGHCLTPPPGHRRRDLARSTSPCLSNVTTH